MRAGGGFGIEEQTLDGNEAPLQEYTDQQGREKSRGAPSAHRAASEEADIRRDEADPAYIPEIPLTECAINGLRLSPKTPEWRLTIIGRREGRALIRNGVSQHLPNAAHHCDAITAGEAMDEDRVSTLPYREARGPILVRGTAHHGVPARP